MDQHAKWLGVISFGLSQSLSGGTQLADAHVDIALREDRNGKLTGTVEGTQTQTLELSTCPSSTVAPGTIKADVMGERSGKTMRLVASAVAYSPPQVSPCPTGGAPGILGGIFAYPQTAAALQGLEGSAKSEYRYDRQLTDPGSGYPFTLEYSILIVHAK